MPALAKGTRLGSYEIVAPLGAGGMGEVYRARDTKLERDVAVKVLPPHLADSASALARFEREAKAVAALAHPNILSIFDFGSDAMSVGEFDISLVPATSPIFARPKSSTLTVPSGRTLMFAGFRSR